MLELTPLSYNERLWISAAVAFALHSFVISALAFGLTPSHSGAPQVICAEMIFENEGVKPQEITCIKPTSSKHQPSKSKVASNQTALQTNESSKAPNSIGSPGVSCDPLFNPPPIYPREARRKKIEGVVHIRLSVSTEGTVEQATVLSPRINPLLEEAALQAVRQWKFKPTAIVLEVPIEFKLEA